MTPYNGQRARDFYTLDRRPWHFSGAAVPPRCWFMAEGASFVPLKPKGLVLWWRGCANRDMVHTAPRGKRKGNFPITFALKPRSQSTSPMTFDWEVGGRLIFNGKTRAFLKTHRLPTMCSCFFKKGYGAFLRSRFEIISMVIWMF